VKNHELQNRAVYFGSPQAPLPIDLTPPFAVLLSAHNKYELLEIQKTTIVLLEAGCIEFCCVGAEAESLHDLIDGIVEDRGAFDVITTFHLDEADACEYFLFAVDSDIKSLLALILPHPSLVAMLREEIEREG
jgi:hypothetical protein